MNIIFPQNLKNIDELKIESRVIEPFSDTVIEFINDISKTILKDSSFKEFPELIALAFWMRKSNLLKLKNHFFEKNRDKIILGRGVAFHIAPSNVDTIFVYSWLLSLLVGNSNIIRISSKDNLQVNLLLNVIVSSLKKYKIFQNRVAIVKYGHIDEITTKLSQKADIRVIWGGDETIKHIRKIPIKPTAIELTFADKFSFSIIKASEFLKEKKIDSFMEKFYNDSFLFSQMACSSTRLIVWSGEKDDIKKAQNIFWEEFSEYVLKRNPLDISPADVINKLVAECSMAIESKIEKVEIKSPFINIIKIKDFKEIKENLHCGAGLFYEMEVKEFSEILPFMTKKHQTISQFGFSKKELTKIIYEFMPIGIDRIVPIGNAMNFNYIWDGYDLLSEFCREISVEV